MNNKPTALWSKRYSPARGHYWQHERNCTSCTAPDWLALYQRDEPNVTFQIAVRKPKA